MILTRLLGHRHGRHIELTVWPRPGGGHRGPECVVWVAAGRGHHRGLAVRLDLRLNSQVRTGGWALGERATLHPRYLVKFAVDLSWRPEYDHRTHRGWRRSIGIRELIDMRPFGLFLERPHDFARRG